MMTLALCRTARAISTICFLAAPSSPTAAVGVDVEIERLQELLGGDVDAAQPVEETLLRPETGSAPTVMVGTRLVSWNTMAMPR